MPDVVIHCFIFFIPFRETAFYRKRECLQKMLLMFVNAVMDLNASDIVVVVFLQYYIIILCYSFYINIKHIYIYSIVLYIILET